MDEKKGDKKEVGEGGGGEGGGVGGGGGVFFFNDTATTEIYTLSLHDALPIYGWFGHNKKTFYMPNHDEAIPPPTKGIQ